MQNLESLKKIVRINHLIYVSVVILFVVAFGNLISANILSTQGISVSVAETETLKIEKENQQLQVKIEEESRLRDLEQVAISQGFKRIHNVVFVPTATTVALK